MKEELNARVRWLLENFRFELAALVWIALLYIWADPERAIPLIRSPWGSLLFLFTVAFAMLGIAWSVLRLCRNLVSALKSWRQEFQRLQQIAMQALQKARERREIRTRKDTE